MFFDWQIVVTMVSLVVAVASALYARHAAKSAENTYSIELIGQLYEMYQSDEMLNNLKIAWKIYHRLWATDCDSKEEAINNANNGFLLKQDTATKYFMKLKIDSSESKAIHFLINFWTYVELLLKRKALKPKEILAFTSPRILGFLCPVARAYEVRYPPSNDEEEAVLEYAYKVLCKTKDGRLLRWKNAASQ